MLQKFRKLTLQRFNSRGISLVDVVIVIIIAGILAAVALRSVVKLSDTARVEEAKQELDEIEYAIVGNPKLYSDNTRGNFGYVGDVGSMPANLDALYSNPGAYATWKGPYVNRRLEQDPNDYKVDPWGTNYAYSGGITVTSTGSGSNIVKKFGEATSDFVSNGVDGIVLDLNGTPPGAIYNDSVSVRLRIPNGSGNFTTLSTMPDNGGYFSLNSVPIGNHDLTIIYTPTSDTLKRFVSVLPKSRPYGEYRLPADVWFDTTSGGGGGGSSQVVTIRPNGSGPSSGNGNSGCSSNWQCVDEVTSDGNTSYVYGGIYYTWTTDTYTATDPSVTGTIDSLKIYARATQVTGDPGDRHMRTVVRTAGTNYFSPIFDLAGVTTYTVYSMTYATNPNTGSAWTWANINSIHLGVSIYDDDVYVTQIWADVFYQ
jgi:hypothetical protein